VPKLDDENYADMKWIQHHTADDPKDDDGWDKDKRSVEKNGHVIQFPVAWRKEMTFVQMLVAKNRNGATGPCELVLQRRTTRFCDAYRKNSNERQSELEGVAI